MEKCRGGLKVGLCPGQTDDLGNDGCGSVGQYNLNRDMSQRVPAGWNHTQVFEDLSAVPGVQNMRFLRTETS